MFSQHQARSDGLQLRKYIVISFPKEFRDQLLLFSRSDRFSPAAIKPHLPPCFQLCCNRALSTQSASASHIAQELRARCATLPFIAPRFEVRKYFPAIFRFVKSKVHFVAFNTLMSIFVTFEHSLEYLIFIGSSKMFISIEKERKKYLAKRFSSARHYILAN